MPTWLIVIFPLVAFLIRTLVRRWLRRLKEDTKNWPDPIQMAALRCHLFSHLRHEPSHPFPPRCFPH